MESTRTSRPTATDRFWAGVEKSDYCWNWVKAVTAAGYGELMVEGKMWLAHRYSYELSVGPIPAGLHVDHVCHNTRCVNPAHLRPVTRSQNMQNRAGLTKRNTSGYRGVFWDKRRERWRVEVGLNGRRYPGGSYTDVHEAGRKAAEMRAVLFTHSQN